MALPAGTIILNLDASLSFDAGAAAIGDESRLPTAPSKCTSNVFTHGGVPHKIYHRNSSVHVESGGLLVLLDRILVLGPNVTDPF